MNTLFARLAAAMFAIVLLLGIAFFVIARVATETYYQEVTQRLNAEIAAHIAAESTLIHDGAVNREALESVAHLAMVINPSTEVYLLDPNGRILGHAAPAGTVTRERISLLPLRAFTAGDATLPLEGDDPRDPLRQKIFSAAEVTADGKLAGYVYIVLGGEKYEALASHIADSYTARLILSAIAISIALAILLGLVVFSLLTRRLRKLMRQVVGFSESDLHRASNLPVPDLRRDELDELGAAFNAMSAKIAEQVTHLEETDRLRRELITNVSHDLRTPLASMQGYIETLMIKDHRLTADERRQFLRVAHKHGERLSRLVDELFELAKLDSGSVEPQLEEFSLPELLHDVGQEFQLKARSRDVTLSIVQPVSDCRVRADIGLIQRVLENLLDNAIRYTPEGGTVQVAMTDRTERVGVTVTDTGCGIEANEIPHIFDRYYRSATMRSGSGLGLAIVKKIVDLHGGRIVVESQPGAGTRFTFDLPSDSVAA